MTKYVEDIFQERLEKALSIIYSYDFEYLRIGLFGSFARKDYNGNSDIDIAIVVNEKPDRKISGSLRDDCEAIGVDVVFVTPEYLETDNSRFAIKLRRDWRELNAK